MDFRYEGDALTAYVTFRDAYALDMALLLNVSLCFPQKSSQLKMIFSTLIDFNVFRELPSLIKPFPYPCTVSIYTNLTISHKKKTIV